MADHSNCPVDKALRIIGQRWNPLIVKHLVSGPKRFCQLEEDLSGITPAMLSKRLKELEDLNIITRRVLPDPPVKVEYYLTEKGQALESVIETMSTWAQDWMVEKP